MAALNMPDGDCSNIARPPSARIFRAVFSWIGISLKGKGQGNPDLLHAYRLTSICLRAGSKNREADATTGYGIMYLGGTSVG